MSAMSQLLSQEFSVGHNAHFNRLREVYQVAGARTWVDQDFQEQNLEVSRSLYVPESLRAGKPRPKALEVYALLSGLSFPNDFTDRLASVQARISEILANRLHYWVKPKNMGVEYCVFKWPKDSWSGEQQGIVREVLASLNPQVFKFHIGGVQINPDGCVVARGYDENAELFRVRALLRAAIPFLPERQSGWAHVPLGRILEPIGVEAFARLRSLIDKLSDSPLASTKIDTMKLIHETRWYMEERETLTEYQLASVCDQGRR